MAATAIPVPTFDVALLAATTHRAYLIARIVHTEPGIGQADLEDVVQGACELLLRDSRRPEPDAVLGWIARAAHRAVAQWRAERECSGIPTDPEDLEYLDW